MHNKLLLQLDKAILPEYAIPRFLKTVDISFYYDSLIFHSQ